MSVTNEQVDSFVSAARMDPVSFGQPGSQLRICGEIAVALDDRNAKLLEALLQVIGAWKLPGSYSKRRRLAIDIASSAIWLNREQQERDGRAR